MLTTVTWLALMACKPAPSAPKANPTADTGPAISDVLLVGTPTLYKVPLNDIVPLVRGLTLQTEAPTKLTVHLDDGERILHVTFPEWSTTHDVPLLGVPTARTIVVTAELQPETGIPLVVDVDRYRTPPLPEPFPSIDIVALDPSRMEPGYTFGTIKSPNPFIHYLVAFDDRMELVWWSDDGGDYGDLRVRPEDAVIIGIRGPNPVHRTFLGEELLRFTKDPTLPHHVAFELGDAHHELFPMPDGSFWTMCSRSLEVPAYPTSMTDPSALGGPQVVADECAAEIGADGRTLRQVWMSDVLDTTRIGFGGLENTSKGKDWVHLNALVPTDDGGLLINSRHQDALIKLDADLQLQWILGDPAGWGLAWQPYLLAADGEFDWPYHTHAAAIAADGTFWLFDNHSEGHTPYTPATEASAEVSRVVQFAVDPDAMTVQQLISWSETSTGPLYSPALGDADPLPNTGNVLADYGFMLGELPMTNDELGHGVRKVRLVEYDPERPELPAFDVRIYSEQEDELAGYQMYRAERIPSLYPADVVVTYTDIR